MGVELGSIRGVTDLYAALRCAAKDWDGSAEDLLTTIVTGLNSGDGLALATAQRLGLVDRELLHAVLRRGKGDEAVCDASALRSWLQDTEVEQIFYPRLDRSRTIALLSAGQVPMMPAFSDRAFDAWFSAQHCDYGLGPYGEQRSVYATDQFADAASAERRTRHLGIDIFAVAGTPVHAPLSGRVAYLCYNADPLDYGHTLILQHDWPTGIFYTLYGHLGASLPRLLHVGQKVIAGDVIGHLGDWHENGGWAPHLHFQVMSTLLNQRSGNFFGVGHASLWDVWSDICIDPNLVMRLGLDRFSALA